MYRLSAAVFAALLLSCWANGQETRSIIAGRVTDPTGAAVPGATVRVTNADTNTTTALTTNETGYYEANLLLPGSYRVAVEAAGFKSYFRDGITLQVSSRADIHVQLQLGTQAESISVTAEAPLLDTSAVSSGRVMDNKSLMDLPVLGNSAILLVKLTPGIQVPGVNNYLGLHSNVGASEYSANGNVGGNEWQIDGVPDTGNSRRAAYLPYSDTIQEFKVETSGFDASIGHTTGVSISMISKSGTNSFHGTLTEQHWQQRWNGTPFFVKQKYYNDIAAAEARGNTALANSLRAQDKQPSGRSNNYAATIGGPVVIPKILNGRDKLFFFFGFNGFKDVKSEDPNSINRNIPTMAERQGDFSQYLKVDPVRYQIYDPLTTRPDSNNRGHYIRDPFIGNVIPRSRFLNPVYDAYVKLLPSPNNPQPDTQEQRNNYLAIATPYNWDYKAFHNRIDYNISQKHRLFGRWSFNDFKEDRGDWTYESARGLHTNGLNRNNKGGTVDWVWNTSPNTIFDFAVAINQFREYNIRPFPMKFKPSEVGFPGYMDEKAGDQHILPFIDFDGAYQDIGVSGVSVPTRYRMLTGKADVTHIRGKHSLKGGFDARGHYRTGGGGGNTSGNFSFRNNYTRRGSDTTVPAGNFAHQWAAFIMGFPNGMSISTQDSYAVLNPYYAVYAQESWRLTSRLTLNLGLRFEYEGGPTERYNRMIGPFDANAPLPITEAAKAAYARSPIPELTPSAFDVRGGSVYVGVNGGSRALWTDQWMLLPRLGLSYQLNSATVLRGGYGIFYDTLNVLNAGPPQTNFSRGTSTQISNDWGTTWLVADPKNGKPPITDPFPVRADGTRFDVPTGSQFGLMAIAGRNFSFDAFDRERARQQRWRAGVQRQLGRSMVIDVAYAGSRSDNVYINRPLNFVPGQYWADGLVRNNDIPRNLNTNVANPFNISNFTGIQASNPALYQDMRTQGRFTSSTIQKSTLLRAYPHLGNTVTLNNSPLGLMRTHALEISFERRFSQGFNFNVGYTAMRGRERDWFANEFDPLPTWRISNDVRPQRLIATTVIELPFGKGRALLTQGPMSWLVGGWQTGITYEWQPGPLIDFGNLFYYGDLDDITRGEGTLDRWFNTEGFERDSTKGPAGYHRRVFPSRLSGLRRDMTNQWNTNVQREFRIRERVKFQLRLDAINATNRSQFNAPTTDPYAKDFFGKVTSQTQATNRWIQIQGRIVF